MPNLLVCIMTCFKLDYYLDDLSIDWCTQKNLRCLDQQARVNTIRDTWIKSLSDIPYKFFYGTRLRATNRAQPQLRPALSDEVYLDCGDNYTENPAKMKAICRWALDHDFEYLLRVDDDTCIFPDRLLLQDKPFWDGKDYSGASASNFHPGGCVFLSRRMMELVIASPVSTYADDVWMGKVAMDNRIPMTTVPTMRNHWGDGYKIPIGADIKDSSYHSCSPDVVQDLWRRYVASQSSTPAVSQTSA